MCIEQEKLFLFPHSTGLCPDRIGATIPSIPCHAKTAFPNNEKRARLCGPASVIQIMFPLRGSTLHGAVDVGDQEHLVKDGGIVHDFAVSKELIALVVAQRTGEDHDLTISDLLKNTIDLCLLFLRDQSIVVGQDSAAFLSAPEVVVNIGSVGSGNRLEEIGKERDPVPDTGDQDGIRSVVCVVKVITGGVSADLGTGL